jgi:manganese transport protein
MPHNLYLHSSLVESRKLDRLDLTAIRDSTIYYSIDAAISLFISFFINVCIIITFANITYSEEITLGNAGLALKNLFGSNSANLIWGLG